MPNKICRRCLIEKPTAEFRENSRYADGYASWCAECHRVRNSEWAKENRERLTAKARTYRDANRDKQRASNRKFKAANKAQLYAEHAAWAAANKDKRRETDAAHRAAKRRAMPKWADRRAITSIYKDAVRLQKETGERMHVDHIIPLQHPLICGLHYAGNLQILPGSINESKRNRWDQSDAEAWKQPRLFDEPKQKPVQQTLELAAPVALAGEGS